MSLCFASLSESSMTNSSEVETLAIQPHKLLILDARSYAAAVANRAKGGGCECPGKSSQLGTASRHNQVNVCLWFWSSVKTTNVILLPAEIKTNYCLHIFFLTTVFLRLQSTIPTARWCLWAWPTSTPSARVSSPCVSSALRCLIQPSTFFFLFVLFTSSSASGFP